MASPPWGPWGGRAGQAVSRGLGSWGRLEGAGAGAAALFSRDLARQRCSRGEKLGGGPRVGEVLVDRGLWASRWCFSCRSGGCVGAPWGWVTRARFCSRVEAAPRGWLTGAVSSAGGGWLRERRAGWGLAGGWGGWRQVGGRAWASTSNLANRERSLPAVSPSSLAGFTATRPAPDPGAAGGAVKRGERRGAVAGAVG